MPVSIAAIAVCGLLFCLSGSKAIAADNSLESLRAALSADIAAQLSKQTSRSGRDRIDRETETLSQLARIDQSDPRQLEDLINDLLSAGPSDKVRAECESLLKRIRALREEKEKQFAAKTDAALHQASETLLRAKTAQDVDPILAQLKELISTWSGENNGRSRNDSGMRLGNALQEAQHWQKYVSSRAAGDAVRAAEALRNIVDNENLGTLVPRSEVLARIRGLEADEEKQAETEAKPILESIHTLDDLPEAVTRLNAQPAIHLGANTRSVLYNLEAISRSYIGWKQGVATSLNLQADQIAGSTPIVIRMRAELFLRTLPRILEIPETNSANPGETVEAYLARIEDQARTASNWELLGRVLGARKQIGLHIAGVWNSSALDEYSAYLYFRQGEAQEQARQFAAAVSAYQSALRQGGRPVPPEVIGQRLDAIKKEHPAEYEEGSKSKRPSTANVSPKHQDSFDSPTQMKVPAASPSASPSP